MTKTENKIFVSAAFFFIIAAFCSDGFYHLDEHYQILEFASYKLGITKSYHMPWEFNEKMRPSIQPWFAYWVHKSLALFGNTNPMNVAITLRLLSAILALFTVKVLYTSTKRFFEVKYHLPLLILSLFIWFNPYLMVRFSSENWSAMLFFLAVSFFFKPETPNNKSFWLIGALIGLSFFIRFQMAFAILGLLGYLIYHKKCSFKQFSFLGFGLSISIIMMVFIDYLFYEKLVFTPWEYFKQNIILNKAANFGIDPWWMYFGWLIEQAYLPVALFILFGLYQLLKNKHLVLLNFIWVPFVIGHFFVGHKELRFLFPMIFLVPYAILETWKKITQLINIKRVYIKLAVIGLSLWNLGLFIYISVTPAKSFVWMYSEMIKYVEPNALVYLASHKNEEWNYPLIYFVDPTVKIVRADSTESITKYPDTPTYIWIKKSEFKYFKPLLGDSITSTVPRWMYHFNINGWVERERNFSLYKVK